MALLPETSGATYPAPRQIENGEAQAGGLDGLWNEHARALMERDNFLRASLTGVGGNAVVITNFNNITKSGFYYAGAEALNAPRAGVDWRVLHITSSGGTEHSQLAFGGDGWFAHRELDDVSLGWGPWVRVLTETVGIASTYASADAPDGWIVGASVKGDTTVTLGAVSGWCLRAGRVAHISLRLQIGGFSVVPNNDDNTNFNLDLRALAVAAGWFSTIQIGGIGQGTIQLAAAAMDTTPLPAYIRVDPATGLLYVSQPDTLALPAQGANADSLLVELMVSILVGD